MKTTEMERKEADRLFYLSVLRGEECQCGKWKRSRMPFCYRCFKRLPVSMQRALYHRLGDGFEEAYEEAVKWLDD